MDRRQQKTRQAIFNGFTTLLSTKNYNQISVQEIIDEANVGRTTFYAHFETKDYLLKELCKDLFNHIIDSAMGHPEAHRHYWDCTAPDSVFLHLIQHLQKNDKHILNLLSSENNDIFRRYFKENLRELVISEYFHGYDAEKATLPDDYLINHICATFVETIDWWLSKNMEESAEVLANYFSRAIEPVLTADK